MHGKCSCFAVCFFPIVDLFRFQLFHVFQLISWAIELAFFTKLIVLSMTLNPRGYFNRGTDKFRTSVKVKNLMKLQFLENKNYLVRRKWLIHSDFFYYTCSILSVIFLHRVFSGHVFYFYKKYWLKAIKLQLPPV